MSENNVHSDSHDEHGHGNITKYIVVFVSLCCLTALSFGIANSSIMDTPSIGWISMMAVSCAKALLVILFFMHLLWEASWKYVLTIPATIMSIFLVIMLVPDIGCRTRKYSEQRWQHAPQPQSTVTHDDDDHGHEDEEEEVDSGV